MGIAGILMTQMLHLPPEYVSGATVQLEMTLCEALAFQWERKIDVLTNSFYQQPGFKPLLPVQLYIS